MFICVRFLLFFILFFFLFLRHAIAAACPAYPAGYCQPAVEGVCDTANGYTDQVGYSCGSSTLMCCVKTIVPNCNTGASCNSCQASEGYNTCGTASGSRFCTNYWYN